METVLSADLKKGLRTVLLFSLFINLALLAPSIFMLQVFDRVLSTRSLETLLMLAAIALLTLGLMGVLDHYRARILAGTGIRFEQRHGPRLLEQLMNASVRQGGRGYVEGMRDLATVRGFLGGPGFIALCDSPWVLVFLLIIFLFHPALGLLAAVCTLALIALAILNERLSQPAVARLRETSQQASRVVDAMLRHAETVTSMGLTRAMTTRWQRRSVQAQGVQLGLSRTSSAINATSRVMRQAVQVLMLGFGTYLVVHDNATPGIMLATTIILGRALAPLEQLIGSWKGLIEARAAWARLQPVLKAAPEGAVGTELPRPIGRLAVEGVSYTPPGATRPSLRGVTLLAEPGQVLALIGASGAGKTTLARVIAGVLAPDAGVVRLDGIDTRSWAPGRLGGWVGYMPQDVALFEGTVAENIARMGDVDPDALLAAAHHAKVHDLIVRLPAGYDTPVGEGGRSLSAGQRQRVALARALFGEPALVVMDEPDASLDAEGEQALLEAIRGLKQRGVTVVVSTQRRAVLAVADQVLVLREGVAERVEPVKPNAQPPTLAAASTGS
ncbi:MAG: type I secretion system permease/ATPase [Rubrivivax sp.]|nr:type I secretion system permease/ATPase [Rubrivivax sp.]